MSLLIVLTLIVLLVVQSRAQYGREQKAYRRGYEDGYRQLTNQHWIPDTANYDGQRPASSAISDKKQTEADQQKVKSQTLNITLYAASLLLVAGVVLFTDAILSHQLALFIVAWIILAIYYVAGLTLHQTTAQLKPVAVAFVGTALAGLPFVGILFNTILGMSGSAAWLITSIVGLLAYVYAAIRLRSQVLGYAITAVILSCGLSSVALLNIGIVWFFVMTLLVAVIMSLVSSQLPAGSKLAHIIKPLEVVGRWLPLSTLAMSLLFSGQLTAFDLGLIWSLTGVYYLARAFNTVRVEYRANENWILTRMVLTVATLFYVYAFSQSSQLLSIAAVVMGCLQVAISVYMLRFRSSGNHLQLQNEISLWFGLGLTLAAPVLLSFGVPEIESARQTTLIALAASVVASLSASWLLRRIELGYIATAALVVLPGLAVYHFDQAAASSTYAISYLEVVLIAVAARLWHESTVGRAVQLYLHITIGLAALLSLIGLMLTDVTGIQLAGYFVLAVVYYILAWRDHRPWVVVVGHTMAITLMWTLFESIGLTAMESTGLTALVATVLFAMLNIAITSWRQDSSDLAKVFLVSAVATGIFFGIISLDSNSNYANLAMLAMMIGASLMLANRQLFGGSIGLLVGVVVLTIAMQKLFAQAAPDVSFLLYAHWWAVVLWLLGYIEYQSGSKKYAIAYGYSGLAIISLFGLGYALAGQSVWYQVLFIVEHSALLLIGLAKAWRPVTIWGAVGVTLAVLWMFRGYTSLFLTLIGILIILAVIWIVRRESSKQV